MGANRNFANKLWNAGRFVVGAISVSPKQAQGEPMWTLADSWIWARLRQLTSNVERLFESYQYGEAGRQIYDFFWSDFADWYIEIAKLQLAEAGDRAFYTADALVEVLDICLRLLHPFTPFVTEELWTHLKTAATQHSAKLEPGRGGAWPEALIVAPWPGPEGDEGWETSALRRFAVVQDVVRSIRNFRAEKGVKPGQKLAAILASQENLEVLKEQKAALAALAHLDEAELAFISEMGQNPEGYVPLVAGSVEIYLSMTGIVDAGEDRSRLEKELAQTNEQIARLEKLLSSDFGKKAPKAVIAKEQERLASFQTTAKSLEEQLKGIA